MEDAFENKASAGLSFEIGKKIYDVEVDEDSITWKEWGKNDVTACCVNYENVLRVDHGVAADTGAFTVTLHYVSKRPDNRWTNVTTELRSENQETCDSVVLKITDRLKGFSHRPRNVLIFVNPEAKGGLKVLTDVVEPLLEFAGITPDIIVTKDENHAAEALATYDLNRVDSIVSLGGDGTFRQVLQGLVVRQAVDEGKNIDSFTTEWNQPAHRIGIIPAGTSDAVLRYLIGTDDPVTATLHIVLGTSMDYDLLAVYNGGKLLALSGLLVGYGLLGDTINFTESHRWLGRVRFPAGLLKIVCAIRSFEAEISYLPAVVNEESGAGHGEESSSSYSKEESTEPQENNIESQEESVPTPEDTTDGLENNVETPTTPDNSDWKIIKGDFKAVNSFVLPMPWTKMAEEPALHVHMIHKECGRFTIVKHFKRFMMQEKDAFDFDHITEYQVKAYRIARVGSSSDVVNIDGDPFPLTGPVIEIRYLPKLLRVFGTGPGGQKAADTNSNPV